MSDFLYSMPQHELSTQIKYVAVMGMTGVGKTTFITALTGDNLTVGHGLSSCTKDINVGEEGTNIHLTGLLYLHRISDVRMQGSALKNIRMFQSLFGENDMANVVLVTTRWNSVTKDEGVSQLRELLEKDRFWGGMIAAGARHEALLDVEADGRRIVQRAGQVVSAELRKMGRKHAEENAELKETLRVEKNSEIAHQLQVAYEEMMQQQERIAEEQQILHKAEMRRVQNQIKTLKHTHHCSLM
ncbi:GTP1/OBG protein [Aspergillus oryzae]|uniref:GTP1/OBG protein n=1 Tax=Aspergillus oryzae TaxID=5062 RepID=A0A1S9DTZ8_ASPOZ|nr:GTP1/OBG protein [Aspergillus oryzae]